MAAKLRREVLKRPSVALPRALLLAVAITVVAAPATTLAAGFGDQLKSPLFKPLIGKPSIIEGKVTAKATKAALGGVSVCIDEIARPEVPVKCGVTESTGQYKFEVPAGTYYVSFRPGPTNKYFAPRYYEEAATVGEATQLTVVEGKTAKVFAKLEPAGVISGTVTLEGAANNEGAEVCAREAGVEDAVAECIETGTSGEYKITNLPAGLYDVEFSDKPHGYVTQFFEATVNEEEETPVEVEAKRTVEGVSATLEEGGEVTGSVSNSVTKSALAGATVCADKAGTFSSYECTTTEAAGKYKLGSLPPGGYTISFEDPSESYDLQFWNDRSNPAEADEVTVAAGSPRTGIDAALVQTGEISGAVTSKNKHAALEGIEVCAIPSDGEGFSTCEFTEEEGEYTIAGLPVGKYKVEFRALTSNYAAQFYKGVSEERNATAVAVEGNEETKSIDAELAELGVITGKVEGEGEPLVGAEVCASMEFGSFEQTCTKTEAGGAYRLEGLEEGEYRVVFTDAGSIYVHQFYNGVSAEDKATPVKVENEKVDEEINADLLEGATIEGEVTGESKGSTKPLTGAEVCAQLRSGSEEPVCAKTNSSGEYAVQGLLAGSYTVEFADSAAGYVTRYYNKAREAATREEGESVEVRLKEKRTAIDGKLLTGGTITGVVTENKSKAALEGADVCAYAAEDEAVQECETTSESGAYSLKGLEAGKYIVSFGPPIFSSLLHQYWQDASKLSEAKDVEVKLEATAEHVDAALREGGAIEGEVKGPHGAVGNANVCAETVEGSEEHEAVCVLSKGDGAYAITGLAPGEYDVKFEDSEADLARQYYKDQASLSNAEAVTVKAESANTAIDATLGEGGTISGTVKAAVGEAPIEEASVCAIPEGGSEGEQFCTRSEATGAYSIPGLTPGAYKVLFQKSGSAYVAQYYKEAATIGEATALHVSAGTSETEIEGRLLEGGKIEGVVRDSEGHPLANALVCAQPLTSESIEEVCEETGETGSYTLRGLASETYTVRFEAETYLPQYFDTAESQTSASPVQVTAPETATGIDGQLAHGGNIEGVVTTGAGKSPVAGAFACPIRQAEGSRETLSCVKTNTKGEYAATNLPPGEYTVEFNAEEAGFETQWYEGSPSLADSTFFDLQDETTKAAIDANLAVGATIEGKVTNSAAKPAPLPRVEVCAVPLSEEGHFCAQTDEEGEYSLKGLAPGKYRVVFTPEEGSFYAAQYYKGAKTKTTAETLTLAAQEKDSGIDAELEEGGVISGNVKNAKAEPVELVKVCANPTTAGAPTDCSHTGALGNYTIRGVATGEYRVEFKPEAGNYLTEFYNGVFESSEATLVKIEQAGQEKSAINAMLTQGGVIRGKVTSSATKIPLEGASVCAEELGRANTSCVYTDSRGEYTITGLNTGKYRVKFSDGSEFRIQYWDAKAKAAEANEVGVKQGETVAEINGALRPKSNEPVPSALHPPTIAGRAEEGRTLNATAASWTNSPNEFTREWLLCNASGAACEPIGGQTGTSYELTSKDVGHTIRFNEEASNEGGPGESESEPTAVVAAKHSEPPPPSEAEIKHDLLAALGNHEVAERLRNVKKHGGASVTVKAPAAGRITILWYYLPKGAHLTSARPVLVASGHLVATRAGTFKLTVKLTAKGKSRLRHAHSAKLTGEATFAASGIKTVKVTHAFRLH